MDFVQQWIITLSVIMTAWTILNLFHSEIALVSIVTGVLGIQVEYKFTRTKLEKVSING